MTDKKPRGFARLSADERRKISSRGGVAAHACGRGHEWTSEQAREVGARGGKTCQARRAQARRPPIFDGTVWIVGPPEPGEVPQ